MHAIPSDERVRDIISALGLSKDKGDEAVQLNSDPVFHAVLEELLKLPQTVLAGMLAQIFVSRDRDNAVSETKNIVKMFLESGL